MAWLLLDAQPEANLYGGEQGLSERFNESVNHSLDETKSEKNPAHKINQSYGMTSTL
jgi:hypothetical protein